MKRFFAILTAIIVLLPASAIVAEKEPYVVTYISSRSENQAFMIALNEIVEMYQKDNPNFNMEIEYIPDRTSYLQKIKILASSNNLPDWFDSDPDTFFASLVDAGYLYDMDLLFEELGIEDRFFKICKDYVRLNDGRMNLFSWQCNTEYFFYNKQIFKDAGITQVPETIDELLETCKKLVAAGYTPFSMGGAAAWPILRYFAMVPFRMSGNKYIEEACLGTGSFGGEVGITGAKYMQKLAKYFQEGWTTADYDTQMDLFTSGQVAMMYDGTWAFGNMTDENMELKDQFGVFGMPAFSSDDVTTKEDYFANAGIGTAVLKDSMDEQMKSFMKFFFENYADTVIKYGALPSIMPNDISGVPGFYKRVMEDATSVNTYAKVWDVMIDSASLETLNSETMNLALGIITPEEWVQAMDNTVHENLK